LKINSCPYMDWRRTGCPPTRRQLRAAPCQPYDNTRTRTGARLWIRRSRRATWSNPSAITI